MLAVWADVAGMACRLEEMLAVMTGAWADDCCVAEEGAFGEK